MFALIALILGIVGIPFAFLLWGCALPMNAIGIFLAWMGLKSERRGMAIVAIGVKYWHDRRCDHSYRCICRSCGFRNIPGELDFIQSFTKNNTLHEDGIIIAIKELLT